MTTAERVSALELRCLRMEERINQILTVLNQVVSNRQVEAITIVLEQDMAALTSQVDECRVRLDILENLS